MAKTPEERRKQEIEEYARDAASRPMMKLNRNQQEDAEYREAMKESGPYMTLGIQMAVSIAAFAGIGYWLDSRYHTGTMWIAIMSGAGAILSLTFFILTVLRLSRQEETKRTKN